MAEHVNDNDAGKWNDENENKEGEECEISNSEIDGLT